MTSTCCLQLTQTVEEPRGMQLASANATRAHYIPHPALLPFPLVTHLLGSTFFRGAAATDNLIAALALYAEKTAAALPGTPGAAQFQVRCHLRGYRRHSAGFWAPYSGQTQGDSLHIMLCFGRTCRDW